MGIVFTGISDEGASGLREQIDLHRQLGWDTLELRSVDGKNVCEMSDNEYAPVEKMLREENMKVCGFASGIANWSREIGGDFQRDRDDLLRAAPRMHRLKCPFLRIMSYTKGDTDETFWASEAIRRVRELTLMAEGEGLVLIHENCDGWASAEPENLARLLGEIDSPALKVVFDMGNPRGHGHDIEKVWGFVKAAEDRIAHIHIKDCSLDNSRKAVHCFPGEGECLVKETVDYMINEKNYRGYLSIEPHMVFQFHKGQTDGAEAERLKAENYLTYGRKTRELFS